MSHTLHRRGTAQSLGRDFIVFSMSAKEINHVGSAPKLAEFLRIALSCGPVNMGDIKTGNMQKVSPEEIISRVQDTSIVHAVFDNPGAVAKVLSLLRERDLGVSVIVSGLFDEVGKCLCAAGLEAHTVEHSLGIKGKVSKLAPPGMLQVTTMCGHGMVSANLVSKGILDIKRGRATPAQAAKTIAKPCECGVFNPARAAELLKELAAVTTFDW
ncbi:MAG: hypothetical protein Q8P50_03805 [Bacillota bacterium]|nr:hypothetical protein [Bacillota bacterium]